MGRNKLKPQRNGRRGRQQNEEDGDPLPCSAFDISLSSPPTEEHVSWPSEDDLEAQYYLSEGPSKYDLYQTSVQSPKGDISYLQKFFILYIGGRSPVHLREDFCGTALICAEWVKSGIQRVATGLDLDLEALTWGLTNNFEKLGGNACDRFQLLHGNVLQPISSAKPVSKLASIYVDKVKMFDTAVFIDPDNTIGTLPRDSMESTTYGALKKEPTIDDTKSPSGGEGHYAWPHVDIVCAFNYSCCCLHNRLDLVVYFKNVLDALSEKGGIFAMDLYGGMSSEDHLKLRRHFPNFTYIWEQEAFDIISRMTKISLHFQLKNNKMIRHAFTYHWRLWSLPEVRDCLKEAGFDSIHFWVRAMPSLEDREDNEDTWDNDSKYEETTVFYQQSAWNAYIVAVVSPHLSKCLVAAK